MNATEHKVSRSSGIAIALTWRRKVEAGESIDILYPLGHFVTPVRDRKVETSSFLTLSFAYVVNR